MPSRRLTVEIINVGNELLDGRTLNTNLQWLCGRLSALGFIVKRAVIVRDDIMDISASIREAIRRKPRWLIISGGLGPTHDDKTLEGVAKAVGKKLKVSDEALELIREHYERMVEKGLIERVELTSARIKMATIPQGARPLRNNVGTAPGVLLRKAGVKIVCLPGVPSELQDIFNNELYPLLLTESRGRKFITKRITVRGVLESSLSPLIDEAMKRFRGVYIKSNPRGFEGGESVIDLDFIVGVSGDDKRAEQLISEAESFLLERLSYGGKTNEGDQPQRHGK